jgi:hypothetical protein
MKTATRKITRKKLPVKKKKKEEKKPRKKRTTTQEAWNNGYHLGFLECSQQMIDYVRETMEKLIELYKTDMEHYPRNTKFVELQLDAIEEFKRMLIYDDEYSPFYERNEKKR